MTRPDALPESVLTQQALSEIIYQSAYACFEHHGTCDVLTSGTCRAWVADDVLKALATHVQAAVREAVAVDEYTRRSIGDAIAGRSLTLNQRDALLELLVRFTTTPPEASRDE